MRLFDVHSHLQDERLASRLGAVLGRARDVGVERIVCCGCTERDWEDVRRIAAAHSEVVPSYALHPMYIESRSGDWLDRLRERLADPAAVVGEIGLDHLVGGIDPLDQEQVFVAQLKLAAEQGRPAAIHCRKAWGRMLEILRAHADFEAGVHIHSFSGSVESLRSVCAMGARVSWSGAVTHPGNRRGQAAVQAVPLNRLLIETDSPDLAPDGADTRSVNEPANLPLVLRCIASLRGLPPGELAEIAWSNSCRLFRRPEAP